LTDDTFSNFSNRSLSLSLEQEISMVDDFTLNNLIDVSLFGDIRLSSSLKIDDTTVIFAMQLWCARHPLTLPPCFSKTKRTDFRLGTPPIYEWPTA
tara:strand:- start:6144 stop:6431 length:288 start_codon:yes stop_codon:yes gene_type:complete